MVFFQKDKEKGKENNKVQVGITAEPSKNAPNVCKFIVDRPLYANSSLSCKSKQMAQGSPLFEALFDLPEIKEALVSDQTLTVSSTELQPQWKILGKKVGEIVRSLIQEGIELIPSSYHQHQQPSADISNKAPHPASLPHSPQRILHSPEAQEIQKLLEEQINPAVASHGGKITLYDYREGVVFLKMEGGCQGCGQAALTLRQGVERAIKQELPHVKEVVDITDHASGTDPYFR